MCHAHPLGVNAIVAVVVCHNDAAVRARGDGERRSQADRRGSGRSATLEALLSTARPGRDSPPAFGLVDPPDPPVSDIRHENLVLRCAGNVRRIAQGCAAQAELGDVSGSVAIARLTIASKVAPQTLGRNDVHEPVCKQEKESA